MNLKTLIAIGACLVTFTACKPDLRTIGTVDDDKLITPAMIDEMGFEEFEKRYLGKEVTVTNFYSAKSTGGYRPKDGQCILAVHSGDKHINRDITIYIYANHWPAFVIEDIFKESGPELTALLNYPNETNLPADVCDERCEYSEETGACFYKSSNLKVTGKIFDARNISNLTGEYRLYMKLKGVQY